MVIILMLNWMIGTERLNSWIELSISDHYRYVSARIVCFRHPVIPILLSRMSSSFPFSFIRKNTVTWLESFPNCSDRFHLTVGSAGSLKVGSTSALVFGCYRTLFFFSGLQHQLEVSGLLELGSLTAFSSLPDRDGYFTRGYYLTRLVRVWV